MDIAHLSNPVDTMTSSAGSRASAPKTVKFELISLDTHQSRARLPMRVQIYPHDTTDSIVTTVKNFYGLYSSATSSKGVSFEDVQHNTLIARYENFTHNMVVYVRVIEEAPLPSDAAGSEPHRSEPLGAPAFAADAHNGFGPPLLNHHTSRAPSTASRGRSQSPPRVLDGRSTSVSANERNGKSRSSVTRESSGHGLAHADGESYNGYTSGDAASTSSFSKSKDQIANTEISVENIVEGGRRKRAKFESSELPLFAPPQMPAATSNPSVSPARRSDHRVSLPFPQNNHNPFTMSRPLPSPHNYANGFAGMNGFPMPASDHRRARNSISYSNGAANGLGIMPTPDPTVGSTMSEEDKDVAMQLMRLGDTSNISHGRTSASTLDDTFSGKADATSSTGATSDVESDNEQEVQYKNISSGNSKTILPTTKTHFMPRPNDMDGDYQLSPTKFVAGNGYQPPKPKTQSTMQKPRAHKVTKSVSSVKAKRMDMSNHIPMSPASLVHSRKGSVSSSVDPMAGDPDHPDLSSKPRCQRCRKSKKGCDRQRPCGRCRDAGIPAELCISEDEGNGRKGRYGRHMGVPIKQEGGGDMAAPPSLLPAAPIMAAGGPLMMAAPMMGGPPMFATPYAPDKSKKRKR